MAADFEITSGPETGTVTLQAEGVSEAEFIAEAFARLHTTLNIKGRLFKINRLIKFRF